MSESSESAEQIVHMTLEGMDYSLRILGNVSKEFISGIYTIMNDKQQTKGKTTLTNMMKSGKPVQIFQIEKKHLKDFAKEARRYGVVYVVVNDKSDIDGKVDIIVKEEDKAKMDRIIEKFSHDAPSKEEDKILKETMDSLEKENVNPHLAQQEKENQSENILKNQQVVDNKEKPSVRAELKKNAEKIKAQNKNNEKSRNTRSNRSKRKNKINFKQKKKESR